MKEEGCFVLLRMLSSDRWDELEEDGSITNNVIQWRCPQCFGLYRLYSVIYFIVVFLSSFEKPHHSLRTFLPQSCVELGCSKHRRWTVRLRHLDYYCCFLTWKLSTSLHTNFFLLCSIPVLVHDCLTPFFLKFACLHARPHILIYAQQQPTQCQHNKLQISITAVIWRTKTRLSDAL